MYGHGRHMSVFFVDPFVRIHGDIPSASLAGPSTRLPSMGSCWTNANFLPHGLSPIVGAHAASIYIATKLASSIDCQICEATCRVKCLINNLFQWGGCYQRCKADNCNDWCSGR
uniref:Uncharacterized protein n=1 Tax=Oryza brachyantha TaxID=4533 RepID=J3LNV7_ORYBR